jgi:hypothetical protein
MDKTIEAPLVSCIKDFFYGGNIENPALMGEYRKLTPEDKKEIRDGLIKNGYNVKALA